MSVRVTLVTPETLTTELGTCAFLHVLEIAPTVTALPPMSVPATTGMPDILKVTDVPHTALQVALMATAQHRTHAPVSKVMPRWLILTMYAHPLVLIRVQMVTAHHQTTVHANQDTRSILQISKAVDAYQNVKTDVSMPSAQIQTHVSAKQGMLRTERSRQTTSVSDESDDPAPLFRSGSTVRTEDTQRNYCVNTM
jgi:hypothetical protein